MRMWSALILVVLLTSCGSVARYPVPTSQVEDGSPDFLGSERESGSGVVPVVGAKSVCVIDAKTGAVVYEKNANQRRAVASVQKLMTALVAVKTIPLEYEYEIQEGDIGIPGSQIEFEIGDRYTLRELLPPLLIKSANDAALVIAKKNTGSPREFVELMNQEALRLGMSQTRFANPHGLTVDLAAQHSTARDIARLAFYVQQDPLIAQLCRQKGVLFERGDGSAKYLPNTNQLLVTRRDCEGLKTGYTKAAGRCLVSKASAGERSLIVVCLGSGDLFRNPNQIWKDSNRLLDHFLYAVDR